MPLLDDDAENVETLRRFGAKAFYGDPTRTRRLMRGGSARRRRDCLVVALADVEETTCRLVRMVQAEFPKLRVIYVRARDRHRTRIC